MNDMIFALDIGTRSVIGLLLEETDQGYQLIDYEIVEHQERSMLDGQIHDVVLVARVIEEVKLALENRHDITLTRACVAAAGRALKTKRTSITKDISQHPLIAKEDILFLELSAVQQAQYDLAHEEDQSNLQTQYYCVGYSVLQYRLDQDLIGSLIDQQGKTAEVEIIATFLPKVVVESLLSALQRANLEMEALTLEPIAAINVLIPESMRRLNVALVDIGAGTSDIALTDEGTITAYGMVAKAGDEITEAISDHYLLDFNEAERVKRDITLANETTLTDILGFQQTVTLEELAKSIAPAIENLADCIAKEILLLNNRAPKAVMLVGGGSLTPQLTEVLANKLSLPKNRVATRGSDAIPNLKTAVEIPPGPIFITPIGIAIAAKQSPVHYISVTVNERAVRLFDMKQLTVGDCLLAAGIQIEKMYGRPGIAYMITFNNQSITLPGSHGQPPQVRLNGSPITIDHPIKHGDELIVKQGENGSEPVVTLSDVIGDVDPYSVQFNGKTYLIEPIIEVNGQSATKDYQLMDHDNVTLRESISLNDWLKQINHDLKLDDLEPYHVYLNHEKKILPDYSNRLTINGEKADLNKRLKPNDQIEYHAGTKPTVEQLLETLEIDYVKTLHVTFNGSPVTLSKNTLDVYQHNQRLDPSMTLATGSEIEFKPLDEQAFIFQDLFRFVSIDVTQIKGNVAILKNGQPATFLDPLAENDQIEIKY
ncbi:cell division protein FtsA [Amphibacillus sediminis]|uniref:cell division protein FtsA n=1 Tax=Amphibacillus sediminis TaxID=360185 RepID=UPI0008308B55|nr:cell division protein FtsA [Amphibacillus sediminis]